MVQSRNGMGSIVSPLEDKNMQRCIDCKFNKWCHDVILDYQLISCSPPITKPIVKKLKEADKVKFNNYHCFRRKTNV